MDVNVGKICRKYYFGVSMTLPAVTLSQASSSYFLKSATFHVEEYFIDFPEESVTSYNLKNHNTRHECSRYQQSNTNQNLLTLFRLVLTFWVLTPTTQTCLPHANSIDQGATFVTIGQLCSVSREKTQTFLMGSWSQFRIYNFPWYSFSNLVRGWLPDVSDKIKGPHCYTN